MKKRGKKYFNKKLSILLIGILLISIATFFILFNNENSSFQYLSRITGNDILSSVEATPTIFSYDSNNLEKNPYYYNGTDYLPINTNISNSEYLNYDKEMTTASYKVYFRNNSNTGGTIDNAPVRFEKEGYIFTYDISQGQMLWRGTDVQPSITDTLGGGCSSNSLDTQVNVEGNKAIYNESFCNTDVEYVIGSDGLKENFILRGLPSFKNYNYLEYSGNIKFNKSLQICTETQCFTPKGTADNFNTSGKIYFKDSNNKTIFFLNEPIIRDSNGSQTLGIYVVSGSDAQMNFDLRINKTFLQNAVYPVYIDPTVLFTTSENVLSVATTPLEENTFALAWCDGSNNDIKFKTYYTNGTNKTGTINVDTSITNCNNVRQVLLSSLTSSTFAIAWWDNSVSYLEFATYYSNGTLISGPTTVDSSKSDSTFSISALSSTTLVVGWGDYYEEAYFSIYYSNGTRISGPINILGSSYYESISVSALSSTEFVMGWGDPYNARVSFSTYWTNGTRKAGIIDVVTGLNTLMFTSVAAINSTKFVIGWYDYNAGDITFATYWTNGTRWSAVVDVDTDVSMYSSNTNPFVSAIDTSSFVIGFEDNTDNDYTFAIYWANGTRMFGPYDSTTSADNQRGVQTVASYNLATNLGFCSQNIVHTFSANSSYAGFIPYYYNGTASNGTCPDLVDPTYSHVSHNNTINGTITNFAINVSDDVALHPNGMYIFSINETGSWKNYSVFGNSGWVKNLTINNSLGDVGSASNPVVFYKDSSWYLISGSSGGAFTGYVLATNGTTWLSNSTIISGLSSVTNGAPTVFYKDSSWYLISGSSGGAFTGYVLATNGTTWLRNTTIATGLSSISNGIPNVFYKDSSWYLIAGDSGGTFSGFAWDGSQWQSNSTITSSLPDIGNAAAPSVFKRDNTWYMIAGNDSGLFNGFNWNGTGWTRDAQINASLPDIGGNSAPCVFQKDNFWYMISGETAGRFFAYSHFYPTYFTTTPSWANFTKILYADGGEMVSYRWYLQDNGGNIISTSTYSFYVTDGGIPTYSHVSHNNTIPGKITNFAINVSDDVALHPNGQYIFSTNNTGVWVNYSSFGSGNYWNNDSTINASLPDVGDFSNPTVFYKDSSWYIIAGEQLSFFNGFVLAANGTTWLVNSTIISGLSNFYGEIMPNVFYKDSSWYLTYGDSMTSITGYVLAANGTTWLRNSTIIDGLNCVGGYCSPEIFYKDSSWYALYGEQNYGNWYGYVLAANGTTWLWNTTILNGLGGISSSGTSTPSAFYKDGELYLIRVANTGTIPQGFLWNGTGWEVNTIINASLPRGVLKTPAIFEKDGLLYSIAGRIDGRFYGYKWIDVNNFSTTPSWANVTKTLNSTIKNVIGYRWYFEDDIGTRSSTPIYTLFADYLAYLSIVSPTTSNYLTTQSSNNISLYFNFSLDGGSTNLTSGINVTKVLIEGIDVASYSIVSTNITTKDFNEFGSGQWTVGTWDYMTNDTTACPDDANDDCMQSLNTANSYTRNSNSIDLSDCLSGTARVYTGYIRSYNSDSDDYLYLSIYSASGGWEEFKITAGNGGTLVTSNNFSLSDGNLTDSFNIGYRTPDQELGEYFSVDNVWVYCDLNQSSLQYTYIPTVGWQVNVTAPVLSFGLKDLFINASYLTYNADDTEIDSILYADITPPKYYSVSHNSTATGQIVRFGINVTDETALHPNGQYIFSTNNSGTWINDSAVNFTSTPSWANVTKTLNSTSGTIVGYRWYFKDNDGNTNSTSIYSLTTTDGIPPTYSHVSHNSTLIGQLTKFSINVTDETALHTNGQYIFSTNNTGSWVNDSAVNFTTTPSWANVTKTLNSTSGTTIGYRWYFSDNVGNTNSTSISTLTVSTPGLSNVKLNATSINNYSSDNLTLTYSLDLYSGTNIYNFTDWRINNVSIAILNMPFDLQITSSSSGAVRDYSTFVNNGTLGIDPTRVPTWTSGGKIGGGYNFDGVDDYILIPATNNRPTGPFTVSLWARANQWSTGSNYPGLFGGLAFGNPTSRGGVALSNYNGLIYCQAYNSTTYIYTTATVPSTGVWTLFTCTYNGSMLKLYFNDALQNSAPGVLGTIDWSGCNSSYNFIGYEQQPSGTNYFNGSIDEVKIYNRSLSAEQIAQEYNAGLNNFSVNTLTAPETHIWDNWTSFVGSCNTTYCFSGISNNIFILKDNIAPIYNSASHNSSSSGEIVRFGINVSDSIALHTDGQYIFSTNNSGSWVNDSAVNFTTTPSWANVTKTLNSTIGTTVGYRWYFSDNDGNTNSTPIYSLITDDTTPPTYEDTMINATGPGEVAGFQVIVDDNSALHTKGQYVFSTNNTGIWINDSILGQEHFAWIPNSTINNSLNLGTAAAPSVFYKDSSWYLLSGGWTGTFSGYVWSGSSWSSNSTIISGLPDLGDYTTPSVFYKDSSWYLISGEQVGYFYGYVWNGTGWQTNLTINSTLARTSGGYSAPSVFYKDSSWYMIQGRNGLPGFVWNGSGWAPNSTINKSLYENVSCGANSPYVFYRGSSLHMLLSDMYCPRGPLGFYWNGTQWQNDSQINSSLTDTKSTVFYKDSSLYLISASSQGFVMGNSTNFTTTPDIASSIKTLNSTNGTIIGYRWYFKDNLGNTNSTPIYTLTISEFTPPTYNLVSHNSTAPGLITRFGINVTDNILLQTRGQYIFSTNNSGSWTNDSAVNFTTTPSWANVTKTLNSTNGTIVGYRWYFTDNAGNTNSTPIYSLTAADFIPPTYQTGSHNSTIANQIVRFGINVTDNILLQTRGQYIFSTNNSGSWTNDSAVNFTTTPSWANVTKTLNSTAGTIIGYRWYFTDNVGNTNSTPIYALTTNDTTSPKYYSVSHNSTSPGLITRFGVNVTDETALQTNGWYIFSTNNSGSWTNDSAVNFTTTPSWANVTKTLNSINGTIIGYRWYFKDNAGNTNSTPIYSLTAADFIPPTYQTGSHNSTIANQIVRFGINVADNVLLQTNGWYIFSTNNSGTWVNYSGDYLSWKSNSTINNSLPYVGSPYSFPNVFYKDESWYMISGAQDGLFDGFVLAANGTTWLVNSTIIDGLSDVGSWARPNVFYKDSSWYLIVGNDTGLFKGYTLAANGTTWLVNSTIIDGLTLTGTYSAPSVFQMYGTWCLIAGNLSGLFNGYYWDGTTWVLEPSLVDGLEDVGNYATPSIFYKDASWYMISGAQDGSFRGFVFDGGIWTVNTTINSSLFDLGDHSAPSVFQKDGYWYILSGEQNGFFKGFKLLEAYSFTTTPSWANVTQTLNSTIGSIVGYRWYFADNAGNTNSTPIYTINTTFGGCAELSGANTVYTLTSDSSSSGTCFTVLADNITINCNNYTISGTNTMNSFGVYSNKFNTTVKNCNIQDFGTGIYYNSVLNGTINNNNITTVYPFNGANGMGVYIYNGTNYTTISNNNMNSTAGYALYLLSGSSNNQIINGTETGYMGGIYVKTNSDNNIIKSTNVEATAPTSCQSIRIENSISNIINGSTSVTQGNCIAIYGLRANYTTIVNSTGRANISRGIVLIYVNDSVVTNSTATSITGRGMSLEASINNSVSRMNIVGNDSTYGAFHLTSSAQNNTIFNSTINGSGGNYVVTLITGINTGNNFTNNTLFNATTLVFINTSSTSNLFYWNNFTNVSGYYVYDNETGNYYNTTIGGNPEGNFWYNVVNGTVNIVGTTFSSYGNGVYLGNSGTGYPYNGTTSLGKVTNSVFDYGPLIFFSSTCSYSSGNWNVDCNDNCTIITNTHLSGNNLTFINAGTFTLNANVTGYNRIVISNRCRIIVNAGQKLGG